MEFTETVKGLEARLGYRFRDKSLCENALTHSSYANENRGAGYASNERLEFLGDSVLGVTVAEHLYRTRPDLAEGQMTRLRAELVCERSLADAANRLKLGPCLKLGRGEERSGGRARASILADAFEAVLAAVFLDGGWTPAGAMVHRFILSGAEHGNDGDTGDYKTTLQELVQRKSGQVLAYALVKAEGPDHEKTFIFDVLLNKKRIGTGSGRSKKEAEQAAARDGLAALEAEDTEEE